MEEQSFLDVELTSALLKTLEPEEGRESKWDVFDLPELPLPTLERFARHGGPDLSDLRFDPDDPESMTLEQWPVTYGSSRCDNVLLECNILSPDQIEVDVPRPYIHLQRMAELARDLDTLSAMRPFSMVEAQLSRFRYFTCLVRSPQQVFNAVWDYFKMEDFETPALINSGFASQRSVAFQGETSMTDNKVVSPNPSWWEGIDQDFVMPEIRERLGGAIDPTGHPVCPIAPNFFLEVQNASGRPDVLRNKARIDGAYGVRAIGTLEVIELTDDDVRPDTGRFTAFTATFEDGTLKLYGHSLRCEDGKILYCMDLVSSYAVDSNVTVFVSATRALWEWRTRAWYIRRAAVRAANARLERRNAQQAV